MNIQNAFRMKTPTRTLDLAPGADPEQFSNGETYTLTPTVRIFADEGKALTDRIVTQSCVVAESAEGWTEIDAPPDSIPKDDEKADMQAAIEIYEGGGQ